MPAFGFTRRESPARGRGCCPCDTRNLPATFEVGRDRVPIAPEGGSYRCAEASEPLPFALQDRGDGTNLSLRKARPASRIALLTLCLCFGFFVQALNAQTVKVHVSSKSGDR